MERVGAKFHTTQSGTKYTYELFTSGTFHLIFLWVIEDTESETSD